VGSGVGVGVGVAVGVEVGVLVIVGVMVGVGVAVGVAVGDGRVAVGEDVGWTVSVGERVPWRALNAYRRGVWPVTEMSVAGSRRNCTNPTITINRGKTPVRSVALSQAGMLFIFLFNSS